MSENLSPGIDSMYDQDSPEKEYIIDKDQQDNIPNSVTDLQIKKGEKEEQIKEVNTITPKKAYMLEDDSEQMDFPSLKSQQENSQISGSKIQEEANIQKPSQARYKKSRKSVSGGQEILVDLRSQAQYVKKQQFGHTQAIPKKLLEIKEERKSRNSEYKQKITKTKIKRQPGDMINLVQDSPDSPLLSRSPKQNKFLMDFSKLNNDQPILFNIRKFEPRKTSYRNIIYNTMKQAQMTFTSQKSLSLKSTQFFKKVQKSDQVTHLLHEVFINFSEADVEDLLALNIRFSHTFQCITWFSYRDQIEPPLPCSKLKTDQGWGCMLRTGQMILFQAVKRHIMGDSFNINMLIDQKIRQKYFNILKQFMDNSKQSIFGIQNICTEGLKHEIKPGQWYGPQMISIVLRNLANQPSQMLKGFKIHVCLDSNIFLDEIEKLIAKDLSVFVLIPLRLGLDSIQQTYLDQVKNLFQIYQNVGIAGGKDHMALYLVGHEDINKASSGMFYLDPHLVQSSVPKQEIEVEKVNFTQYLDSYHNTDLRTLAPSDMCTSMAPGFYIRDLESFTQWKNQIKLMKNSYKDNCIFSVFDKKPQFLLEEEEKIQDSFDLEDDLEDFYEVVGQPQSKIKQAVPPQHFLNDNPYTKHRIHNINAYNTIEKKVKPNANYTKSVAVKEINQTTSDNSDDFEII